MSCILWISTGLLLVIVFWHMMFRRINNKKTQNIIYKRRIYFCLLVTIMDAFYQFITDKAIDIETKLMQYDLYKRS